MAYQASWGSRKFEMSLKQIKALTNLSISDSYSADKDDDGKVKGREPTTFTIETTIITAVAGRGKSARSEMQAWRKLCGKTAYFYLNGSKLFNVHYRLTKVDASNIMLDNSGRMLQVKLGLTFEQTKKKSKNAPATDSPKTKVTTVKQKKGRFMRWPVPKIKEVSSNYGPRDSKQYGRESHSGIDVAGPIGTKIIASAAGTVVMAGNNGKYGLCIIIDHGNKVWSMYGHCSSLLVKKGKKVKAGQAIAKMGKTGNAKSSHLHFEVRRDANDSHYHISPWTYLNR